MEIYGLVGKGDRYGRRLGFPTANLDRRQYARQKRHVRLGVYAGWATLPSGRKYLAGIVIGPLDKYGLPKLEAHLLDFKGNLYGRRISIYLKQYLRPFRRFQSEAELKQQIKKDLQNIKRLKL